MIHIINKKIYCPLCLEPFLEITGRYRGKAVRTFVCRTDKIFTFIFDPAFNKWFDTDKTIPCGNCGHKKVLWFLRHMDDYFKSVCPECGLVQESDTRAGFTEKGLIELPEFTQNQAQDMGEIMIPIKSLKMPEDAKNALKLKLKQRSQQNGTA